jgi:hypothetical protein
VKAYSLLLGILATAFLARVVGQALVAFLHVGFLPPMKEWYSGLLPYPVLLPVQIAILAFQFEVSRQLWRKSGPLTKPRPRLGRVLKWFSLVYFLAMLARYVITMTLHPEQRWFGGAIPIAFHWVLAAYLYFFSRFCRGLPLSLRAVPFWKLGIVACVVMFAAAAFVLFQAEPPSAPDMSVTLLGCSNLPGSTGYQIIREAEYEIINRSDGSVRLHRVIVEQRDGSQFLPAGPGLLSLAPPARATSPDILRPGERRKIALRFSSRPNRPAEFRGVCSVTPEVPRSRLLAWIRQQPWAKHFPVGRPAPSPGSYSFSSAWEEKP